MDDGNSACLGDRNLQDALLIGCMDRNVRSEMVRGRLKNWNTN